MRTFGIAAVVIAAAMFGSTAMGDLASITFDLMDADYNGAGAFTLNAEQDTYGEVSRIVPVAGQAKYDNDVANGYVGSWFNLGTSAGVAVSMSISNITAATADGSGSFTVIDADGDTITGNFSGTWLNLGGAAAFAGNASSVFFNDITAADTTFDGPSGGNFSTNFAAAQPFGGWVIDLTTSGWFVDAGGAARPYSNMNTHFDVRVIPLPGAALLGMIGFGAVSWVRRRLA